MTSDASRRSWSGNVLPCGPAERYIAGMGDVLCMVY